MSSSNYHFVDSQGATAGGGMNNALNASKSRSNRSKWLVIGTIVTIIILAAVGTTVGVIVSRNNSKDSSEDSKSSSGSGSGSSSGGNKDDTKGGDTKGGDVKSDPALHQVLYGMAYTPHNALLDFGCANTQESVDRDIKLISQLTTRVRLYGADCNQTAQVLEAIQKAGVDLNVYLGIYTLPDDDHEAYHRQKEAIQEALQTYGSDHVHGITVGNEFMLNWATRNNLTSAEINSPIAQQGSAVLVTDIAETRLMLEELGMSHVLVGNSDAGSFFSTDVLSAVDYGLSNVHAWFANTTADMAADWVFDFFESENVAPAALLPNNPKMYIAETGWPTGAKDVGSETNNFGVASIDGLQTFLDTFICRANEMGVGYFFFEMFDEAWKDEKYGGVEGYWGLFNGDRTLKDVTLPKC